MQKQTTPLAETPEEKNASTQPDLLAMEKQLEELKAINNGKAVCDECGKICKNAFGLEVHKTRAHGHGNTPVVCPHCERTFSSALGLRTHLLRKHEGRNWSNREATVASATKRREARYSKPPAAHVPQIPAVNGEQAALMVPNFCPMCGYDGLRAIFLAMNFKKEGA